MVPPSGPESEPGRRARRLGRRGERAAARALKRRGYRILARNLRTPAGEVDVLAQEGGQTVLVEVKTGGPGARAPVSNEVLATRFGRRQRRRQQSVVAWLRRHADFRHAWFRHDLVLVAFDGRHFVVTIRRDVLAE